MELSTIVIIVVIASVFSVIIKINADSNKKKVLSSAFDNIQNFNPTQSFVSKNLTNAIAIDEVRQKICIITNLYYIRNKIINFNDVLSSELFIDNDTITKTSRMSQIGGTLVGSALLGGAGAIIGGLSGKKIASDLVKKIDLRLVINDMADPIIDINFLNLETKKNSSIYTESLNTARHWSGVFDIIIKNSDKN